MFVLVGLSNYNKAVLVSWFDSILPFIELPKDFWFQWKWHTLSNKSTELCRPRPGVQLELRFKFDEVILSWVIWGSVVGKVLDLCPTDETLNTGVCIEYTEFVLN